MNLSYTARQFLTLPALIWVCLSAQAGRPLTVDDANVNDTGVAHVETFWSRGADGARVLTIAPTYSPLPGLDCPYLVGWAAQPNDSNQTAVEPTPRKRLPHRAGFWRDALAKGPRAKRFHECQFKL